LRAAANEINRAGEEMLREDWPSIHDPRCSPGTALMLIQQLLGSADEGDADAGPGVAPNLWERIEELCSEALEKACDALPAPAGVRVAGRLLQSCNQIRGLIPNSMRSANTSSRLSASTQRAARDTQHSLAGEESIRRLHPAGAEQLEQRVHLGVQSLWSSPIKEKRRKA